MPRKKHISKSIEDIYCNKLFVPPKEQNLETIFEEPRQSKDGAPILTSVRKYKRYLHFDPSQNKIQKRKQKAKKCVKKLKLDSRVTRSSPDSSKSNDISVYMLDVLGDSSSDSDMDESVTYNTTPDTAVHTEQTSNVNINSERSESLTTVCETPKRNDYKRRPSTLLEQDKDLFHTSDKIEKSNYASEETESNVHLDAEKFDSNNAEEASDSPRRSCCIS